MCDFPDVPAGVSEARRARAPRTIDRPVEHDDTSGLKIRAEGVDVVDVNREDESGSGIASGHACWLDEFGRGGDLQQVDERVAEPEDGGVWVFERDRQPEWPSPTSSRQCRRPRPTWWRTSGTLRTSSRF